MAGRHRSFDRDDVLERLMGVFWRNGYAGTSMADLTEATGLNKPSLYAAFGNKEEIFKATFALYVSQRGDMMAGTLGAEGMRLADRITAYLRQSVDDAVEDGVPIGCFFLSSTCEMLGSSMPALAREDVTCAADEMAVQGRLFFEAEIELGNLPPETSPEAMAGMLAALQAGLVSLALRGASQAELELVMQQGLKAFPTVD